MSSRLEGKYRRSAWGQTLYTIPFHFWMLIKYLPRGILYNDVQKRKIHCDGRRDEGQPCPAHSSSEAPSNCTRSTNPGGSITASSRIRYSFVSLRFVKIAVVSCSAEWLNQCRDQFMISVVFHLKKIEFFIPLICNMNIPRIANAVQVTICRLVSTSVY